LVFSGYASNVEKEKITKNVYCKINAAKNESFNICICTDWGCYYFL